MVKVENKKILFIAFYSLHSLVSAIFTLGVGEAYSVACATEFERANKRASFKISNSFNDALHFKLHP